MCLMENVFTRAIPYNTKRKLKTLHESDVNLMAKHGDNVQNKDLYSLYRHYQQQEVLAMSWTLYHNAALHVHRYEKHSKQILVH